MVFKDEMERLVKEVEQGVEDIKDPLVEPIFVDNCYDPGCRVRIFWENFKWDDEDLEDMGIDENSDFEEHYSDYDTGYIFTIPGCDSNDISMTGVVHIPRPCGGEKSQPEPEWHSLHSLSNNPQVDRIEISKHL